MTIFKILEDVLGGFGEQQKNSAFNLGGRDF